MEEFGEVGLAVGAGDLIWLWMDYGLLLMRERKTSAQSVRRR
jgi:hypothetical protein